MSEYSFVEKPFLEQLNVLGWKVIDQGPGIPTDPTKSLRTSFREVEKQKEIVIASARTKITETEAKKLILTRFKRLLTEQFDNYLRQYQRAFIAAIENLWAKYAITTKQILAERDREADQLNAFLKELGYE
jgi:type I restriction enzyme M protein